MTTVYKLMTSNHSTYIYWYSNTKGRSDYSDVDDPIGSPDDDSTYIYSTSDGYSWSSDFGFSAFSIPSGSTSISLTVFMRAWSTSGYQGSIAQEIIVGGTQYRPSTFAPSYVQYTNYTYTWSTNPKRSSAWTVDDINGVGSYALQYVGIYGASGSYYDAKYGWTYYPVRCTQIYCYVTYTPGDRLYAFACGVGTVVGSKSTSVG